MQDVARGADRLLVVQTMSAYREDTNYRILSKSIVRLQAAMGCFDRMSAKVSATTR